MAERIEDRLRDALDLLTEGVPHRQGPPPVLRLTPRRWPPTPRRTMPVVMAFAVLVAGMVLVAHRHAGGGTQTRQVTGPAPQTSASIQLATAPAPSMTGSPRSAYPTAPTVAASPLTRAMLAFGFGDQTHWTWFVVDGADDQVRAAADVPTASRGPLALSPDGRHLAYALVANTQVRPVPSPADFVQQVVVVDLTDGAETRVAAAGVVDLSWSGDGSRLSWIDGPESQPGSRLVVTDPGGGRATVAAVTAGRRRAVWSPDGKHIAVAGCQTGACPVLIVDSGTMAVRQLPQSLTDSVAWTPDGHELVDASGQAVTAVQVDGNGQHQLTNDVGSLYPLAHPFSPDGTRFLLRPPSSGVGLAYTHVVNVADGRVVGQLSDAQEVPYVLGWNGDAAVLVAREEGSAIVLYRVPLDGSPRAPLYSTNLRNEGLSPNSWVVADWLTRG